MVYKALETVSYLASHQDNKETLTGHPVLVGALESVRDSHHDEEITALATYVLCQLDQAPSQQQPARGEQAAASASPGAKAAAPSTPAKVDAAPEGGVSGGVKQEKKGVTMLKSARTYMIRVQGLKGEEDKADVERTIIRARGVISVSLDQIELGDVWTMRIMAMRQLSLRAVVRAKCEVETIMAAIEKAGFSATNLDNLKASGVGDKSGGEGQKGGGEPGAAETPMSQMSTVASGDGSPRYLAPPESGENYGPGGDQVLVSLHDAMLERSRDRDEGWSWIKKVGRMLW